MQEARVFLVEQALACPTGLFPFKLRHSSPFLFFALFVSSWLIPSLYVLCRTPSESIRFNRFP